MYGGHITDPWDRLTNSTYLDVYVEPRIYIIFSVWREINMYTEK